MSWLKKIGRSLKKTSASFTNFFQTKTRLDEASLAELEEILLGSDLGISLTDRLITAIREKYAAQPQPDAQLESVRAYLAAEIAAILQPRAGTLSLLPAAHGQTNQDNQSSQNQTKVILLCGINGSGKTTTASKLAHQICAATSNKDTHIGSRPNPQSSVILAACDTFRAAATEQLEAWGQRLGIPVIRGKPQQEPASVAYQALLEARAAQADFLIIDTAGRMHNNANLMAELEKFIRVLNKIDPTAPHEVILVLDGTNGQNALAQTEIFAAKLPLTGIIINKLDGTSKAGFVVSLAERFEIPFYGLGVGEQPGDMDPFLAQEFALSIVGLDGSGAGTGSGPDAPNE